MKKTIIIISLALAFGTQILPEHKEDSKRAYAELLTKCQAIRARILKENNFEAIKQSMQTPFDFEPIRRAELTKFQSEILPRIIEQAYHGNYHSSGSAQQYKIQKAKNDFDEWLRSMESQYNNERTTRLLAFESKLRAIIAQTVAAFLHTTNTTSSKYLLAELIANGFSF